jgi:hypothetical protein
MADEIMQNLIVRAYPPPDPSEPQDTWGIGFTLFPVPDISCFAIRPDVYANISAMCNEIPYILDVGISLPQIIFDYKNNYWTCQCESWNIDGSDDERYTKTYFLLVNEMSHILQHLLVAGVRFYDASDNTI